jgi:hypothetical protein
MVRRWFPAGRILPVTIGSKTVGSKTVGSLAIAWVAGLSCATAARAEPFPSASSFTLSYTFTTSTPASPIDVGEGRDLTVNRYLTTTLNDAGTGFLHLTAGRCTNIRFTNRQDRTIDSKGYCNFRDRDGDILYAEYTTSGPKPLKAITLTWNFKSGTGKYDGISGTATDTNSGNLDDGDSYQAGGKMTGSYKIIRSGTSNGNALVLPSDAPER